MRSSGQARPGRRRALRNLAVLAAAGKCGYARAGQAKQYIVLRVPATAAVQAEYRLDFDGRLAAALAPLGQRRGRDYEFVVQWVGDPEPARSEDLRRIAAGPTHAVVLFGVRQALNMRELVPSVPIVAWGVQDPVAAGLAASFVRPGGNVTGLTQSLAVINSKWLEILQSFDASLTGIAVFAQVRVPMFPETEVVIAALREAIKARGLRYRFVSNSGEGAFDALEALRKEGINAAIYWTNPVPLGRSTARRHAAKAIRERIATACYFENMPEDGFLFSYAEAEDDLFVRLAQQVDRILRGVHPSVIPFMEPQRFHFRLNARTADELGLRIPHELRVLADKVIE